ncbi:hypothetical protein [Peterkaempfera griseoplana]|uniref:hypothetical protein n=1 Tax=Peterkaempfera griseoplana TaxID=66896 RepID=UPI0006E17A82|nr:hypothetical protein [Peterkaempfera griseoplana]
MNHDASPQEEPAEHLRFWAYLDELAQVTESDEVELVGRVLGDPDRTMAQSAVVRHLDRRAADLGPEPAYDSWAEKMTRATTGFPFLTRRLHEWSLFRAVISGRQWSPESLLGSSDWLQLKTADASDHTALTILAEHGRTRRIRNTARSNLGRRRGRY